ncbi:MAG: hypothetical protein K6D95_03535 [Treponema sp.]|nr:hypothetical protein [Treponema sp.]
MEEKPGWTYRFIPTLNMQIAINDSTGVMYTEDKTKYTPEEQHLLQAIDYQLPLSVHLVKKVFEGTILSFTLF